MSKRLLRPVVPARLALLAAAMLVIGPVTTTRALGETGGRPSFVDGRCGALDLSPEVASRTRCGTVAVPRDRQHPDRGTFALAVVVIASATRPVQPDADLYVSGGPGGPLTVYAEAQARHPLAPDHDQILVDQRGTGASEPALCPGLDRDLAAAVATDRASEAKRRDVYAACHAEAVARGFDLADFGTTVTVEDLEAVRQALGIARWNVFGVSYGTTVAMTMLARHPETVRAAVLDSVYPPDPILPPWSQNVAEAREAFFASCEADEGCRSAYPDLSGSFRDTMAGLAQKTPTIAVPHGMGRPDDEALLTPSLFAFIVGRLVYYPTFYPGLARLVAAAHDGDTGPVASALSTLFEEESDPRTGSRLSLRAAVECRDRPRFHGPPPPSGGVPDMTSLSGICDGWAPLGPPPLVPRGTEVPTLILAGQFDPNARPADSRRVAGMIGPRAHWVEFEGMGHSVRAFSPCASAVVAAFIAHPDGPIDEACAGRAPPLPVLPPHRGR